METNDNGNVLILCSTDQFGNECKIYMNGNYDAGYVIAKFEWLPEFDSGDKPDGMVDLRAIHLKRKAAQYGFTKWIKVKNNYSFVNRRARG